MEYTNKISDALCDARDVLTALKFSKLDGMPKDNDGTATSVGDCLENIISFLEWLPNLDHVIPLFRKDELDSRAIERLGRDLTEEEFEAITTHLHGCDSLWDNFWDEFEFCLGNIERSDLPKLKPWDYVRTRDNSIQGSVVSIDEDASTVQVTNDKGDCELVEIELHRLIKLDRPSIGWGYEWADNLEKKFGGSARYNFTLYPTSSAPEQSIQASAFKREAVKRDWTIYREHIGRDHYHYYIPGFDVFINENYA